MRVADSSVVGGSERKYARARQVDARIIDVLSGGSCLCVRRGNIHVDPLGMIFAMVVNGRRAVGVALGAVDARSNGSLGHHVVTGKSGDSAVVGLTRVCRSLSPGKRHVSTTGKVSRV